MSFQGLHHVALPVPDLSEAEAYYRDLFDMAVLFREGALDGRRGKVPDGFDWPAAIAQGVEPHRCVLGRDAFALALVPTSGDRRGQTTSIALRIDLDDLGPLAANAASIECGVVERETGAVLTDRYGVEWELTAAGFPPTSNYDTLVL